jgi:hypothetical protein
MCDQWLECMHSDKIGNRGTCIDNIIFNFAFFVLIIDTDGNGRITYIFVRELIKHTLLNFIFFVKVTYLSFKLNNF